MGALRLLGSQPASAPRGDEFGFDPDFSERVHAIALWLYRNYWRVETEGVANVPARGRALLVANRGGPVPYDGAMIRTAILAEHPQPRQLRMLVASSAFALPFASIVLVKGGDVREHPDNAISLLERNELVGTFPEGVDGAIKRYRNRYRVGRLGRGEFVRIALRTGAPIVPVSVVGAGDVHPMLHDLRPVAELLGLPAFPITPTFPWLGLGGLLPLPSKWFISFGRPVDVTRYGTEAADDSRLVIELSEQVRETIQAGINQLLPRRRTIFH